MIDKLNIPLENKDTKKIEYTLWLDEGYWSKIEYNAEGNLIYSETSEGYWSKQEYDNEGNIIYFETSDGYIKDDR